MLGIDVTNFKYEDVKDGDDDENDEFCLVIAEKEEHKVKDKVEEKASSKKFTEEVRKEKEDIIEKVKEFEKQTGKVKKPRQPRKKKDENETVSPIAQQALASVPAATKIQFSNAEAQKQDLKTKPESDVQKCDMCPLVFRMGAEKSLHMDRVHVAPKIQQLQRPVPMSTNSQPNPGFSQMTPVQFQKVMSTLPQRPTPTPTYAPRPAQPQPTLVKPLKTPGGAQIMTMTSPQARPVQTQMVTMTSVQARLAQPQIMTMNSPQARPAQPQPKPVHSMSPWQTRPAQPQTQIRTGQPQHIKQTTSQPQIRQVQPQLVQPQPTKPPPDSLSLAIALAELENLMPEAPDIRKQEIQALLPQQPKSNSQVLQTSWEGQAVKRQEVEGGSSQEQASKKARQEVQVELEEDVSKEDSELIDSFFSTPPEAPVVIRCDQCDFRAKKNIELKMHKRNKHKG